ncbi:MAG: AAA family ATPase [Planctomycetes bacterium]|nr:AAA family ATPase [Planctomycetota bacterium]
MRRIAIINQKGGVGKTTTVANLGAALAQLGRRVVVIDLDAQANLSLHLDVPADPGQASIYTVLSGETSLADAVRPTKTTNLSIVSSNIDLSGAELELASAIGRESLLRDALEAWEREAREKDGRAPADYLLIDCPPSLGLLSINGLVAAGETIVTLQTEFFALQGMSKLMEVLKLLQKRLNPSLAIAGILPCMYDSRLKLAREVYAEIKKYFPGLVFARAIGKNVKLAEAPSYGRTIFEYAPECSGASDYNALAVELLHQEARDPELASLPRPERVGAVAATETLVEKTLVPQAKERRAPKPASPVATEAPKPRAPEVAPAAPQGSVREPTNGHAHDEPPHAAVEPARAVVVLAAPETSFENRLSDYELDATLALEPVNPNGIELELPELPPDALLLADDAASNGS